MSEEKRDISIIVEESYEGIPTMADMFDSAFTEEQWGHYVEIRKAIEESHVAKPIFCKPGDGIFRQWFIDVNVKSMDFREIDELRKKLIGDDKSFEPLVDVLSRHKIYTVSRILGTQIVFFTNECSLSATEYALTNCGLRIGKYELLIRFIQAINDAIARDKAGERLFASEATKHAKAFYARYRESENIRSDGRIRPVRLKQVRKRLSEIARLIENAPDVVENRDGARKKALLYTYFDASPANARYSVEMDGAFLKFTDRGSYVATEGECRKIPWRTVYRCADFFLRYAHSVFKAREIDTIEGLYKENHWELLSRRITHLKHGESRELYARQINEFGQVKYAGSKSKDSLSVFTTNLPKFEQKTWFEEAVEQEFVDEAEDEALLLDAIRLVIFGVVDELSIEHNIKLKKREKALRTYPVIIFLLCACGAVALYAIYRYRLIDQPLGQYPLLAVLTICFATLLTIGYTIYRNARYKRGNQQRKMTRWTWAVSSVFFALMVTGCYFMARYDAYDDTFYYNRRSGETMVVAGLFDKKREEITIPERYKDREIVGIADNSFVWCNSLQQVNLQPNCTTIGANAFFDCNSLKVVSASAESVSLRSGAFFGCDRLESVYLNETDVLPAAVFKYCKSLREVTGLQSVREIQKDSFKNCRSFNTTTTFNELQVIAKRAFENTAMEKLELGTSLAIIDEKAFKGCKALTEVSIRANDAAIGKNAFQGCTALNSVQLDGVQSIAKKSFNGCTAVTSITVPYIGSTIDKEESLQFLFGKNVSSIREVIVTDEAVTVIPKDCFKGCSSLTSVTFASEIDEIGERGFKDCSGLERTNALQTAKKVGKQAFMNCRFLEDIDSDSIEVIEKEAFKNCTSITSIRLGNLKSLGKDTFKGCASVRKLTVPYIGATIDDTRSVQYLFGNAVSMVQEISVTDEAFTVIPEDCFNGCSSLNKITFAGKIEAIQEGGFYGCSSLPTTDALSTAKTIGKQAFKNCYSLGDVESDSVETIGKEAFKNCTSITSLRLKNVTRFGQKSFEGCDSVKKLVIPYVGETIDDAKSLRYLLGDAVASVQEITITDEAFTVIPEDCFHWCTSLTTISFAGKIDSIEDNGFNGCSSLQTTDALSYARTIGAGAFAGCVSLRGLCLPQTSEIGERAFANCTSIEEIDLQGASVAIREEAFIGCSGIHELALAGNVHYVGENAFLGLSLEECTLSFVGESPENPGSIGHMFGSTKSNLRKVTVTEQTSYGDGSFEGCLLLSEVSLPEATDRLGESMFKDCPRLTTITVLSHVTDIPAYAFYGCTSIKTLESVPNASVISSYAFAHSGICDALILSSEMSVIGEYAFGSCLGLRKVETADNGSDLAIRESAFADCDALRTVTFNRRVVEMGKDMLNETIVATCTLPFIGTSIDREKTISYLFGTAQGMVQSVTVTEQVSYADSTFEDSWSLTEVVLPETTEELGESMFRGCYALTTLNVLPYVKEIPEYAFCGCTGIKSLQCFPNVRTISGHAFAESGIAGTLVISESIEEIGEHAFSDCSGLQKVETTEDGMDLVIANEAFSGCVTLHSADFNQRVVSFGKKIVNDCGTFTSLRLPFLGENANKPKDLEYITGNRMPYVKYVSITEDSSFAKKAFKNAKQLEEITFEKGISEITKEMFKGCIALTAVNGPVLADTIQESAFADCYSLGTLDLSFVRVIGKKAFYDSAITRITIASNVKTIQAEAFAKCNLLRELTFTEDGEALRIEKKAFAYCSELTELDLPGRITAIQKNAFTDCGALTTLRADYIGADKARKTIKYVFGSTAKRLEYIEIRKQDVIINGMFSDCSSLREIVLSDAVTKIPTKAFKGCTLLTTVRAAGIVSIGNKAFKNCRNLTSIPYVSQLKTIGAQAFYNTGVTTFHLTSDTLRSIGRKAFAKSSLREISIDSSSGKLKVGNYAFKNCKDLETLSIPHASRIGIGAFRNCTYLRNVTLPYIGRNARLKKTMKDIFGSSGAKRIQNITITEQTVLAANTFKGCSDLQTITFLQELTKVKRGSFKNCSSLTRVNLGNSLTTIEKETFQNCYSLVELTLPSTVTKIGARAFRGCTSLRSIQLPDALKTISRAAFRDCNSLVRIDIPENVHVISKNTFYGCTELQTIIIEGELTKIDTYAFAECGTTVSGFLFLKEYYGGFTLYYLQGEDSWDHVKKRSSWATESKYDIVFRYNNYEDDSEPYGDDSYNDGYEYGYEEGNGYYTITYG